MDEYYFPSTDTFHVPGFFACIQDWKVDKNFDVMGVLKAGYPTIPENILQKIIDGKYEVKDKTVIVKS